MLPIFIDNFSSNVFSFFTDFVLYSNISLKTLSELFKYNNEFKILNDKLYL